MHVHTSFICELRDGKRCGRENIQTSSLKSFPLEDLLFDASSSPHGFSKVKDICILVRVDKDQNVMYNKYLCSAAIFGCDAEERYHCYG